MVSVVIDRVYVLFYENDTKLLKDLLNECNIDNRKKSPMVIELIKEALEARRMKRES